MPAPFAVENEASGQVLWTVDASGNTTQIGNLTVTGNGTVTGNLTVNGTLTPTTFSPATITTTGNITDGGNLSVAGTTALTGNATAAGTLGVTGALTASAAATVGTTLGVTGATTLSSTLGVTGATTLSSTLGVTGLTTASAGVNLPSIATPSTPSTSSTLYAVTATNLPAYVSPSGQVGFVPGTVQAINATTTVANTTSETALVSYTVPANDVAAGAVYRVTAYGVYSWTATPTIQFILEWGGAGGTALATIPAITLGTAKTNAGFRFEAMVSARSTTSVWSDLKVTLAADPAVASSTTYEFAPSSATTITSNTGKALAVTVTWGTQSTSNTISVVGGAVERIA